MEAAIGIGSSFRESFRRYSVFSDGISSRGEDEDEALQWAALERLPTYDRLRKGIIMDPSGEIREVDVHSLNVEEKRKLLERLVKVAEDDNERFLKKLKDRMDRVGIENPTIEVRFENLEVSAEAYVGDRGVPTIINSFLNKIEEALNFLRVLPSRKVPISILHGISGIIKPSRLTLLLGPPGSGKTTLLLALAGKLDSSLKVSGNVTYNGYNMNEFVPQRTSAYISQNDVHIGQMTVRETLAFSARCQGVGTRYDMLMELSKREKAANIKPDPDIDLFMKAAVAKGQEYVITDYVMKVLGLEICANTVVGDRMMRGISGGQKKRVTTGEMLVGPSKALFMDEISTGLDSSTTFQIINSLKQSVHILNSTALIALLQPAPETYELFDDIILLSEGQIVYQGPREHVLSFFEFMGFKCPERKGVADFLQEVTSRKDQEQYWMERDKPYRFISVNEFADAFHSFHVGQHLENAIVVPFDKTKSHPAALTMSKYGISKKELLRTCLSREYLLMKRNSFVYIFKLIQVFITGLIAMTVFIRSKMHHDTVEDANIYLGALFVGLLTHLYNGFAELAMSLDRLPIFYKQRDLRFYPAWAYSLPSWILKIPVSIVECALWTGLTYYVIGFDSNVQRMFRQYLIFTLLSQMAFGLFRFLAALGRDVVIANTFGTFAMIVLLVLGGFALSRNNIGDWWIWGYWGSPLMYAQNAVAVNEFLGHSWRQVVNVTGAPETLGVLLLKSRGYFPESYWYWIGVGGLLGYVFILNFLFAIALTFLDPIGKGQTVLSKEILNDKEANRTGKHIEQPNQEKSSPSHSRSTGLTSQPENCTAQTKKGMVLPFTPLAITFENIKYSVDMPSEMKEQGIGEDRLLLLNDLNGAFRPGVLTALMGVSGAGKTTLMDLLAGRKTGGYIEGSITISGYPKNQETFARVSGYCEQNDIHSPNVTVYESLLYSAWLRLPAEVNSTTRKMFIEEVMELVELTSLRESIVGLPGVNGLSTEQRKRLTIAVELIANPSIIFMDEPTSGLDARAAAIVMRAVRNTVDTGRTVVCTIHQPSIDIFESFDELFLIKRGGEEIYVGPLGRHSFHLINYFEAIDGLAKIRDGYNPATWMLEVTTSGQEEALGLNFTAIYKNSELYMRNKALIRELSQPAPGSQDLHFPTQYSQPFFVQCLACLWKQHKSYWRNPSYSATRIFFTIITSLLFGTIFWRLGSKRATRQDLFNAIGGLYAAVMFVGVQNSQMVQPVVDVERTVFYREKAAGMYAALPYAIGQVVIEVPYVLLQTLIYEIIVYSMVDFAWTVPKFFWFFFFIFTAFLYFTFYGMMAVALTPNSTIAAVVATIFYNVWNLFAGFILPRPRIPIWWRWYYWICPVSWTLYGLLTSQFGDIKDIMETGETVEAYMKRFYGYKRELIGVAAIATIGFDVLFAFIFAYSIKSFNFQKR